MSLYVLLSSNCLLSISNTVYVSVVMSVENGALSVTKKSETAPPEPEDGPILYGRHDKIVPLKEAVNV